MTTTSLYEGAPAVAHAKRDTVRAIGRGLAMRCPCCGEGKLFRAYLKTVDACAVCGEVLHHHRSDDAPPYLTIFVVGHIVVAMAVAAMAASDEVPLWAHMVLWPLVALGLSLALLPRFKGAIVGLQWAQRMHGFSGSEDVPAGTP